VQQELTSERRTSGYGDLVEEPAEAVQKSGNAAPYRVSVAVDAHEASSAPSNQLIIPGNVSPELQEQIDRSKRMADTLDGHVEEIQAS
jgi:hypothetical protein